MSEPIIDVDDGSWESAQTLAAQYGADYRRLRDEGRRYMPGDVRRAVLMREAQDAEQRCIEWSYTAYERWIGSPDWADWHECELAKDGQVIERN